jgi:uncharacterized membrane protein (DUF4010 family)
MSGLGYFKEVMAIVAITTTLLSLKEKLHFFVKKIKQEELYAFIKFVLLALLVMPILPKTPFNTVDTLNPFDIGVVIVFISLLSFISYLLMRFMVALALFFMQQWFGSSGVYATGLIVGAADVDAVTINVSKLHLITPQIAVNVIIMASLSNTLIKLSVVLLRGSAELRKSVLMRLGSMLLVCCAYLLIVFVF